jgi:pimeloyl-ACP methyl ester carboxylesterase
LFFMDYGAENSYLALSAIDLRSFIHTIYPSLPPAYSVCSLSDVDWRLSRHDNVEIEIRDVQQYRRLILVGHSLGAVVIRRLIADECVDVSQSGSLELSAAIRVAELRLFAPAHKGFRPSARKRVLWKAPILGAALQLFASSHRAFLDLVEGCDTLQQLQRETEQAALAFPSLAALRPHVLWDELEDIVVVGRYDTDQPRFIRKVGGRNHIDVCKVYEDYKEAAYFVVDGRDQPG